MQQQEHTEDRQSKASLSLSKGKKQCSDEQMVVNDTRAWLRHSTRTLLSLDTGECTIHHHPATQCRKAPQL
jgi:hypothetical protein